MSKSCLSDLLPGDVDEPELVQYVLQRVDRGARRGGGGHHPVGHYLVKYFQSLAMKYFRCVNISWRQRSSPPPAERE